jgi:hypothetical protein
VRETVLLRLNRDRARSLVEILGLNGAGDGSFDQLALGRADQVTEILRQLAGEVNRITQEIQEAGPLAPSAISGLIQEVLSLPEALHSLWEAEYRRAVLDDSLDLPDLQQQRKDPEYIFTAFLAAAHVTHALAGGLGHAHEEWGERRAALDQAADAIEQMLRRFSEEWPVDTEEEGATTDADGGGALPIDDAFAEIAGVDRETWLRRMEERKQQGP